MATSEQESNSPPLKQPQMECIIHCSDDGDKLVSLQSVDSWRTLLRAAQICNHAPVIELAKDIPEGQIPEIYYHRKCRSIFTMKKDLDGILAKEKKTVSSCAEQTKSERAVRQAPSTSRTYDTVWIFCQKTNKYIKGQNTRDVLVQCRELRADAKIRSAATKKMDSRILAIVSRDLVAAEGHYHRSCYRLYTKDEVSKEVVATNEDDDAAAQYEAAVNQSYNELFCFIRMELFGSPQVMTMTNLTSRLVASMNSLGIVHVKESTIKHLRRKLESEFAGALHIFPDAKGKLLLYPDNLSMREPAKQHQSLRDELLALKSVSAQDVIAKAAIKLRADIKSQDVPQVWPPEVKPEAECPVIPESLMVFLYYLLTGCNDPDHTSQRVQRLVQSFGHDIVYAVTCGKTQPSKHIILPFSVKSLTGNVELINILNRLGHSVSYSQMQEIETALCLQKLSSSRSDTVLHFIGDAPHIPEPQPGHINLIKSAR